ncbi:MAG: hypothetical protein IJI47_04285 [Eubacterium sp.]|nr:hypothetical protein [Eubacterium sp.]MBR0412766.1 hypothetical protein [Eubacterium sp.]
MKNYQQDYNLEPKDTDEEKLAKFIDDSAVNKIIAAWIVCVIFFYGYLLICAVLYYTSDELITILDPIDIYLDYVYRFGTGANILLFLLRSAAFIAQHTLVIIGRKKYPANEKMNKYFRIDMAILAVTVIAVLIIVAIFGVLWIMCDSCG